ncbi:MAG: NAD(P)-binding protein [Terriglobia bacterium]|jgi:NADPH-dependent glutamate synthase beta subunit-like oxidoreductase/Pyruvate/2-oxoacid:ferredoxin oxidoreductase delta subunit
MVVFKAVKKPVVKGASTAGSEVSHLRPRFIAKTPPCVEGCPCGTDIRGWINTISQAQEYGRTPEQAYEMAWQTITDRNPFPAVCGRVCPHPCEDACNRIEKDGAVAINALERFVGDFGIEKGLKLAALTEEKREEKIAVVGAGPAGLSCAYQLARRGYPVTVFEAFSKPGGMLRYGIPQYRLPRNVLDAEIQKILDLGVELKCNQVVGDGLSLGTIKDEYKAVFVGIGAHKGLKLGLPGEDAPNVFTGTSFLNHVNRGEEVSVGNKVIVIGGGDTAIDAARVSKRLGAAVTILYRRSRQEMPAIKEEIEGAIEEGIDIQFLAAPVEILAADGPATGMRCIRMELGEPDASGRRRPVPQPGSEFDLEATAIIAAISQEPEFAGFNGLHEGKDWIKADEWGTTGVEGVYAGGDDLALGLVTIAIAQGRFAAEAIDARLRGKTAEKPILPGVIKTDRMKLGYYENGSPHERPRIPVTERDMGTEIEQSLSEADALAEAKRCMSCGMCMDCETCWMFCTNNGFAKLPKGEHFKIKLELCNGCQKCAQECPCGYIDMV